MNAMPAKVAGVGRLVMVVPAPRGEVNPAVLAAAHLAGISEVYRIGGAQAVAALAYGTETIKPVAKIVGPGNAYVAEAKRQVFGIVGHRYRSPGHPRSSSLRTRARTRYGSRPTSWRKPNTTKPPSRF